MKQDLTTLVTETLLKRRIRHCVIALVAFLLGCLANMFLGEPRIIEVETIVNADEYKEPEPKPETVKLGHFPVLPSETCCYFRRHKPADEKEKKQIAYIERFDVVAQSEHAKFGIPASVKLAQGLLETSAGTSRLATRNNNHFGVKCFSRNCRKGHCSNFTDDSHKDFFRIYDSAWESWRAHSKMIVGGRYKKCLQHGDDWKKWCDCLKANGYATQKYYSQNLQKLIERYKLWQLD